MCVAAGVCRWSWIRKYLQWKYNIFPIPWSLSFNTFTCVLLLSNIYTYTLSPTSFKTKQSKPDHFREGWNSINFVVVEGFKKGFHVLFPGKHMEEAGILNPNFQCSIYYRNYYTRTWIHYAWFQPPFAKPVTYWSAII